MKTKLFKTTITLILLIVGSFLLTSFLTPQNQKKFITVRVLECKGAWDSHISIGYEDGKIEEIALEKFSQISFTSNTKKINEVINTISNKGYDLITQSSAGGENIFVHTYTFERK